MKQLIYIITGIILGIISKYGDISNIKTLYTIGLVTSGLQLYLTIYTIIIISSKNKKEALKNITSFMLPMLISYYIFSHIYVHYIYKKIILFWLIIFIISLITTSIIHSKKETKLFKILYIIASLIFIIIDAIYIHGIQIKIIIIETIIFLIGLFIINRKKNKNDKHRR